MLKITMKLLWMSYSYFTQEMFPTRSLIWGLKCDENSEVFQCNKALQLFQNFISEIYGVSGITATQRNTDVMCTRGGDCAGWSSLQNKQSNKAVEKDAKSWIVHSQWANWSFQRNVATQSADYQISLTVRKQLTEQNTSQDDSLHKEMCINNKR